MRLVQILIPSAQASGAHDLEAVGAVLTEKFGGVTAYVQMPAEGYWRNPHDANVERDLVVLIEVMVDHWDTVWWRDYRATLEGIFQQKEIVIRALPIETP